MNVKDFDSSSSLNCPKLVARLRRKIERCYYKRFKGRVGNADDCVSFVFSAFLKNKKQTVMQAVLDYGRSEMSIRVRKNNRQIVDDRTKFYFAKSFDPRLHRQIDPTNPDQKIQIAQVAARIPDQIDRACFFLYWKWGLNMEEIGEVFNLTESAISLRLSKLVSRLTSGR